MPLANVVEPRVVSARPGEEAVELRFVIVWLAHEASIRTAASLNRNVDESKQFASHVLAHQQTADFLPASANQFTLKPFCYRWWNQNMHFGIP